MKLVIQMLILYQRRHLPSLHPSPRKEIWGRGSLSLSSCNRCIAANEWTYQNELHELDDERELGSHRSATYLSHCDQSLCSIEILGINHISLVITSRSEHEELNRTKLNKRLKSKCCRSAAVVVARRLLSYRCSGFESLPVGDGGLMGHYEGLMGRLRQDLTGQVSKDQGGRVLQ